MQIGYIELPDGRYEFSPAIPEDVKLDPIIFPMVSQDIEIQGRYEDMRLAGESHNMADMLAHRTGPGIRSDSIFNEAKFSSDSGLIGVQQKWLRQQAESAGVSTNGKWYCSGLASFPGDPTAWVGDRGDVLRIAREKNMTVHGYVEHQAVKDLSDSANLADAPIAQDVIDDGVEDYLEAHPFAPIEEATEAVLRTRGGHEDYNPLLVKDYGDEVFSDD